MQNIDITTAHLNGDIDEEILMKKVKILEKSLMNIIKRTDPNVLVRIKIETLIENLQKNHEVCQLKRALYRIEQAGRQW